MQEQFKERAGKRHGARFWILLALVAIALSVVVSTLVSRLRDKPATLVQTANFDEEVDYAKGEIVDYRFAFNAMQERRISPVEENGWRLILQALGPIAAGASPLADSVPWEEFPTSPESKDWFEKTWTPLCEKFKLDPHVRPTLIDHVSLSDYVGKYGLTGDEPEPDEDSFEFGFYWENNKRRPRRISTVDVSKKLLGKPWTAEEYPCAARWLDENADYYDVLTKAAHSPRLAGWDFVDEPSKGGFLFSFGPFVPAIESFVEALRIRANYRIGSGDLDGALDDVETIVLFGRALLENESISPSEITAGDRLLQQALAVRLFANRDAAPTSEQIERAVALRSPFCRDAYIDRIIESFRKADETILLATFEDLLLARRTESGLDELADIGCFSTAGLARAQISLFLTRASINDGKTFRDFKEEFLSDEFKPEKIENNWFIERAPLSYLGKTSPEKRLFQFHQALLLNYGKMPSEELDDYFYALDCAFKESTLALALLAYEAEHGALPPAFTVDANGAPLHSWRVLILPYLGEAERELYGKLRLDEPWDSEANRAFHGQAPEVFRHGADPGATTFSVLLGEDGLFDASGQGKNLDELRKLPDRDIASQYMIMQRADPICWMKPDAELTVDGFKSEDGFDPAKFIGEFHLGIMDGIYAARADGSVALISVGAPPEEFERGLRGVAAPDSRARAEGE